LFAGAFLCAFGNPALVIVMTIAGLLIMGVGVGLGLVLFKRRLSMARPAHAQHLASPADEIAERERLTAELEYHVKLTTVALDHMAQGLSIWDEHNRLVVHNRRYSELYGIPPELLKPGITFEEIRNLFETRSVLSHRPTHAYDADPHADRDHELCLPNGRIVLFQRRRLPGGGSVATHDDVTEARLASRQIAYLAAHDMLTGLPNRVTFAAHLDACAKSGQHFAVHTIDLDRFKEVNDTLGHPVGDEILKGAATRLRDLMGPKDVVSRFGGDEFALIQSDVDGAVTPDALASRIVERLSEPFEFAGHTIVIGASVGISLAVKDSTDGDELLKMSDLALYRAKEESRGTYRFFERGMDSRLCERRQLEDDLRTAIQEGQFEVHYQPLLDMAKGTIACFEALVRWRHPSRGLIQPADFIATAEDSGLIIPIGEWVLRQACRDAAGWPNDVGVAVNVSPAQFKRGDLIAMTISALTAAGLDAARLEIEITEAVLLHDEAWVQSVLERLAAFGVRIVMDDFGTGYSSLSYLRSFPFNKIKIDRSFIVDLVKTPDALSIVQATIQLSKKLGMEITAEGVETAEQLEILVAEGCSQIQGYHFSRPVPASEVGNLLRFFNTDPSIAFRTAG
jgi:diguanylate cyclase (GGDEF)-like protein